MVDEQIGNYKLLQSVRSLGPPDPEQHHQSYDYYHLKDGVTLATARGDDKILRITHNRRELAITTSKGVLVGSTESDVISVYGKDYYRRSEQGAEILGYVDKTKKRELEFWMVVVRYIPFVSIWRLWRK
ncbi:hypothetical protein [Paenibacillus xerothermodurans]|uniref:Uncharacterized protein n=1 Tax=Paenibacillus xerothermodurans TaxID=1977292 RepID=A0A2W1N2V8_PAEXE|nr:hypothetical protein [Paenibacillus xerothermodurans]PZE19029.1 hypothetical protein CBW46_020605 [Paenibacillus xerothermodurans]